MGVVGVVGVVGVDGVVWVDGVFPQKEVKCPKNVTFVQLDQSCW